MMLKAFTLAAVVAVASAGCVKDCGCPASMEAAGTDMKFMICSSTCLTKCMGTDTSMESTMKCALAAAADCPILAAGAAAVSNGGLDASDLGDLLDSVSSDLGGLVDSVSSMEMDFDLSDMSALSPELFAKMVDMQIGGMTEDMPDAMKSILEGPLNKLKTDKELFGKFMTMMMDNPCSDVSQSCTNGVCTCTGDADCCIDMERSMERSMCQSKCAANGNSEDCMDACGNDDDDGIDLSDPMTQKMFDLLDVDMNEVKAAKAAMELETQKSLVTAAEEALTVAGCSAARGRRDAVQCSLDCVTNNAGNPQATATCAAGCASAVGVDLNAVSGFVGGQGGGAAQCASTCMSNNLNDLNAATACAAKCGSGNGGGNGNKGSVTAGQGGGAGGGNGGGNGNTAGADEACAELREQLAAAKTALAGGAAIAVDQVKDGFMAAIAAAKQLYASQGCSRRGRRDVAGCLDSCGCPKSLTDTTCVTACATTTDYTKAAANGQAVAAFTTKCLKSGGVTAGTVANTATVTNTATADPCVALKQGIATAEANLATYAASSAATATASLAVAAVAAAAMFL